MRINICLYSNHNPTMQAQTLRNKYKKPISQHYWAFGLQIYNTHAMTTSFNVPACLKLLHSFFLPHLKSLKSRTVRRERKKREKMSITSTAAYVARRAAQKERVRILYRRALKDALNWAVHRRIFYEDVCFLSLSQSLFLSLDIFRSQSFETAISTWIFQCINRSFCFFISRLIDSAKSSKQTDMWFVSLIFFFFIIFLWNLDSNYGTITFCRTIHVLRFVREISVGKIGDFVSIRFLNNYVFKMVNCMWSGVKVGNVTEQ